MSLIWVEGVIVTRLTCGPRRIRGARNFATEDPLVADGAASLAGGACMTRTEICVSWYEDFLQLSSEHV
jgi:hypothetical protein